MPMHTRQRFVWVMAILIVSATWSSALAAGPVPATGPADSRTTSAALAGTWESVSRSQGGIGQILELRRDGTAIRRAAAMVDFTYKLDGDRLVASFTDPKTGKVQETVHHVRFEGDRLIQSAQGRDLKLTRVQPGRPGSPQIVGVWSYPHEAGGTALVMYTPDSRMVFRLPMRSDRGTWSGAPTELTMSFSGPRTLRYHVDGDRLVLTDDQGKTHEYRRAELADYPPGS